MLAAIQAHIIYLIMRVVEDTPQHPESDLQMLMSFQVSHGHLSLVMISLLPNRWRSFAIASEKFVASRSARTNKRTLVRIGKTGSLLNRDEGM